MFVKIYYRKKNQKEKLYRKTIPRVIKKLIKDQRYDLYLKLKININSKYEWRKSAN